MKDVVEHSQILVWAINITTGLIVCGWFFSFLRLLKGPSLPDRVVSVDVITVLAVATAGVLAVSNNEPDYLDVGVALALVAFLATISFAWYADRRAEQFRERNRSAESKEER